MTAEALLASQVAEQHANTTMVEEKTRELAVAKKVAEDALRAELQSQEQQVRFMEVISHQYRTPLAAIRSNVDAIGVSLPDSDAANRERLERAPPRRRAPRRNARDQSVAQPPAGIRRSGRISFRRC